MDPGHLRLAEIGLRVAGRYGFALSGGYAIQAHGILQRPSEDVGLFTAGKRRGDFAAAFEAVIDGYRTNGYTVEGHPDGAHGRHHERRTIDCARYTCLSSDR